MSLSEIQASYADYADWLHRFERFDRLVTGRYRSDRFGDMEGKVLDVACGTGTNFRYLPEMVELVGIDISPEMLENAETQLSELGKEGTLRQMDAQDLDFPDDSFDAVISALSTCTFPDPVAALQEMERVCKPDGTIRLVEHGRSDVRPIARYQEWRAFDLMASAALTQQSQHHMWIHYLGHIGETLVEEFELADDADPSDEFPNDYARLLYEIHTTLRQLVRNAASQHFKGRKAITDPGVSEENDLLKYSLRTLLRCHRAVLLSSDIPNRFKRERTHSIYELYEELDISNAQKSSLYADALLQYMSSLDSRNPVGGRGQLEYLEETSRHLRTYDTARLTTGGREQFEEMNKRISHNRSPQSLRPTVTRLTQNVVLVLKCLQFRVTWEGQPVP